MFGIPEFRRASRRRGWVCSLAMLAALGMLMAACGQDVRVFDQPIGPQSTATPEERNAVATLMAAVARARATTVNPSSMTPGSTAINAPSATPSPTPLTLNERPGLSDEQRQALSGVNGQVLVPPEGLAPFASLRVREVKAQSTEYLLYTIRYADLASPPAMVDILAFLGPERYTSTVGESAGCGPSVAYCTRDGSGTPGVPAVEMFYGLRVDDWPAVVGHVFGGNSNIWAVTWYDEHAGITYTIETRNGPSVEFGVGLTPDNLGGARSLATLAGQLAPLND